MKIAILQFDLVWEEPSKNRRRIENILNYSNERPDLILLPEMFSTGFTMNPRNVAEPMNGNTVTWMKGLSKKFDSAVAGSLVISEGSDYFNRFIFVTPSGELSFYDKRHLFSLAGEHEVYTAGKEKVIIEYKGWRICPQICYDLRFPVFSRNMETYDLLIYVANWPETRILAWDALLKARAIENMCYVVGVNRIGQDKNDLNYIGHSQLIDPLGKLLIEPDEREGLFVETIDLGSLKEIRAKLPFLNDMDSFTVN